MLQLKKDKDGNILDTSLKYQYLIDEQNISSPCPSKCKPVNLVAYRFVESTTINSDQFLPTVIEDKKNNITRRSNDEAVKCLKCAISLFNSEENAVKKLKLLSTRLKEKWTKNYIAKGKLEEEDGLTSAPDSQGHFSFYEYNNSEYLSKFAVVRRAL